jgi:DNA-binding beta-propeller fold protein YncE
MPRMLLLSGLVALALSGCRESRPANETRSSAPERPHQLFATLRAPHDRVAVFDRDGNRGQDLVGEGLATPFGIHADGDHLYVVSQGTNAIYVHRDTRDRRPDQLSILVPSGSGGLSKPFYVVARHGELYVSSHETDQILRYDARSGAHMGVFVDAGAGGLDGPRGLAFDKTGNLYVASSLDGRVLVYDARGTFSRVLATGIGVPCGLAVDPNNRICVGSAVEGGGVHCFDKQGTSIYRSGDGRVCGLDFGPNGHVYIARTDLNTIEVHDLDGTVSTFATAPMVGDVSWQ